MYAIIFRFMIIFSIKKCTALKLNFDRTENSIKRLFLLHIFLVELFVLFFYKIINYD